MRAFSLLDNRAARPAILGLMLAALLPPPGLGAAEVAVESTVVYRTPDGIYVDAGTERGVQEGDTGIVTREGREIARVEAIKVTRSTALLRVIAGNAQDPPRVGDLIRLLVSGEESAQTAEGGAQAISPTLENRDSEKPFVPLLAPPEQRSVGLTEASDIFHGRVWLKELFQVEGEQVSDYSLARLGSSGSYERIAGSPWTFEWSGDLSYRDGHALRNTRDYQKLVLHMHRLSVFRKFDDGSTVRAGRFLPHELPGVGYLDGAQGEKVLNQHLRLGGMLGFKPTRTRLDVTLREPMIVPYVTAEAGEAERVYYSGTAGFLGSLYEGKPDRLALLLDQSATVASRLSLFSTGEVDFDIGGAETRSAVSLTRLDIFGNYAFAPILNLRAGLDHYQRPDTQAERDLLPFQDDEFFDRGYWRYFLGGSHDLPWKLRLSEEFSFTDSPTDDYTFRWNVSLTKADLPFLPGSHATLTVYNLEGFGTEGYGARLHAYLPFLNHRLSVVPGLAIRILEPDLDPEDFQLADVSLRFNWAATRSWSFHGGVSHAFGTEIARYLFDLGITFRW